MKKKSLLNTNPYLKNKRLREEMFLQSVTSSTAIEGVHIRLNKQKYKIKK
jgi:hypothetical protein